MKEKIVYCIALFLLSSCNSFLVNDRFIKNHENVLLDTKTNQLWTLEHPVFEGDQHKIAKMQKGTCLSKYTGWRLPTEDEISELIDYFNRSGRSFQKDFNLSSSQIWIGDTDCDHQFIRIFDLKLSYSYLVPVSPGLQSVSLLTRSRTLPN